MIPQSLPRAFVRELNARIAATWMVAAASPESRQAVERVLREQLASRVAEAPTDATWTEEARDALVLAVLDG